jgi:GxxExxY protein
MNQREINALGDKIRQLAFEIHVYFRHGHLEKIYENALVRRLIKAGIKAQQQYPLSVSDEDGTLLGEYYVDILVEDFLVLEIKAAKALAPEHEAQVFGYLRASRLQHALLLNFGAAKFQIRKFALSTTNDNQKFT